MTVLFVATIGILIVSGAMFVLANSFAAIGGSERADLAYAAAESGIENGILQLTRNPEYSGGTLTISTNQSADVTISTQSGIVITSVGTSGSVSKKIVATGHYDTLTVVIDSWMEEP